MTFNLKAQGSIEYLLLIAGAVLVAVVVVIFSASLVPTEPVENATFDPLCLVLSNSRCTDTSLTDNPRDLDGDGVFDCTWVDAVKECHACKGDRTSPTYDCPANS